MRKYLELMKSAWKMEFAYSAWFWAGTFSALLRLLIFYFFWNAVYANQTSVGGMSLAVMITYVTVAMFLEGYTLGTARELAEKIRDGSIGIELMRPYDLLSKLLALDIGGKVSRSIREVLPLALLAYLALGVQLPAGWTAFGLFILSAAFGVFIGTVIDLGIGMLAFWTGNIFGLSMLRGAVIGFFSGSLIPVTLFPDWLRAISPYLPFQSMVYVPVSIYTGQLAGSAALEAIALQAVWLACVLVFVRFCWSAALRKVTVFGG